MSGDVPHPLVLTASELRAMRHVSVQATDHGGTAATYNGVPHA